LLTSPDLEVSLKRCFAGAVPISEPLFRCLVLGTKRYQAPAHHSEVRLLRGSGRADQSPARRAGRDPGTSPSSLPSRMEPRAFGHIVPTG
jgi:hypothetical protein